MNTADTNIAISLNLFGDLRRYLPPGQDGPMRITCAPGTKVVDLLRRLGIADEAETAISLNGELASITDVLHDGDEVVLFGPTAGG